MNNSMYIQISTLGEKVLTFMYQGVTIEHINFRKVLYAVMTKDGQVLKINILHEY